MYQNGQIIINHKPLRKKKIFILFPNNCYYFLSINICFTAPNNFQSLLLRAEILYKLQQYQSSLADADRAIKMQKISAKAFYQKAQALAALGKFEESLISLCLVICLDSKMEIFTTSNFERNLSTVSKSLLCLLIILSGKE